MRGYLAAVSLMCAMGTAAAQGIEACGTSVESNTADLLADALAHARLERSALGSPVSGSCDVVADRRSGSGTRAERAPAAKKPRNPEDYRFDMSQHGKQMTAEDFDRWMKARGIRIAKGPQPVKPVARAERKRGR